MADPAGSPSHPSSASVDRRTLVLAPTGRDGELAVEILSANGLVARRCSSAFELCAEAGHGAGLALIADEALNREARHHVLDLLRAQPFWSDLPVIVLARRGEEVGPLHSALQSECNMTILERPVQISTLVSAVQAALRARNRQYEVRDLVRQLQDTDRRKDEFIAMLGHELRNPLGVIRTAIELLRQCEGLGDHVRQVARIDHQIAHLSRMVDDLLDLSRVSRGRITLKPQPVDLTLVAARALESCQAMTQGRPVSFERPESGVWVAGDPVRLEQVTNNLLQNALKYTPPDRAIQLSVAVDGDEALLRVRDEGIGIKPEALERVFETFTQLTPSLARSAGGLGLGLSLVRHLVRLHGGSVSAFSDGPGRGSEFVVRLPTLADERIPRDQATDGPAAPADEPVAPVSTSNTLPAILVVEDLVDAREALGELLELAGFEVELAPDGNAALEAAARHAPQIALVDIGLPGLDGYEVARQLRASLGTDVTLIAMTGYGQLEDRRRAHDAGFDHHLVKPVDPRLLLSMLQRGGQAPPEREPPGKRSVA